MKISYNWLNNRFFNKTLPSPQEIADVLTMHAFEVESIEKQATDIIFDIKVLPNRSHDCLSHKGMAREIATLLGKKIHYKPEKISLNEGNDPQKSAAQKTSDHVELAIQEGTLCYRATKRMVYDVTIGESPAWLKEYLVAVGQKPINNVVDCANFVLLETGQPVHTFDLDKIGGNGREKKKITIRNAQNGEIVKGLDGKEYKLTPEMMVIADDVRALDVAGIKGGADSGIDSNTKRVLVSACNFDAISIRKTSKKLALRTDASVRFENETTPALIDDASELLVALLEMYAGGKAAPDMVDAYSKAYPKKENPYMLGVSLSEINSILGSRMSAAFVSKMLDKAGFSYKIVADPVKEIVKSAPTFTGVPYKWSATVRFDAPHHFDCSSFVMYLFTRVGIHIPRVSIDQYVFGEPVEMKDIQPGDLLFFSKKEKDTHYKTIIFKKGTEVPEGVDHVALYLGNDFIAHATTRSNSVVVENFQNNPIQKNLVGVRRMVTQKEKRFVVEVPSERLDLRIKEDLIEEIQRLAGYEDIKPVALAPQRPVTKIEKRAYYQAKLRQAFAETGFSEVYTYAFVAEGKKELLNPIASNKNFLRQALTPSLTDALTTNDTYKDLLGLKQVKIFEIGTIFSADSETLSLAVGIKKMNAKEKALDVIQAALMHVFSSLNSGSVESANTGESIIANIQKEVAETPALTIFEIDLGKIIDTLPEPTQFDIERDNKKIHFAPISPYPFIVRDVAVFVPTKISSEKVLKKVMEHTGPLLVAHTLFDIFTKKFPDGTEKTSYAFRLVFQSNERTLTDGEVNEIMKKVTDTLNAQKDWQVR